MSIDKRSEIVEKLVAKAHGDETFKQELLANPKAAIEKELKIKIEDSVDITVLEETPTKRYIVLPAPLPSDDFELSDIELDMVAGGTVNVTPTAKHPNS